MNKRILKCGSSVYAVGEEGSLADLQEKAGRCSMCSTERCEADNERTSKIWGEIKQLILDLIGKDEDPDGYTKSGHRYGAWDVARIESRNEQKDELRKIVTGGKE